MDLTAEAISKIAEMERRALEITIDRAREDEPVFLVKPSGVDVEDITSKIEALRETPRRRSGTVTITSVASFIEFVARMAQPNTVLFADQKKSSITALFDYHDPLQPPGLRSEDEIAALKAQTSAGTASVNEVKAQIDERDPSPQSPPLPRWNKYRAFYAFPQSRPYMTWAWNNAKPMSQASLADFIEDNLLDVVAPSLISLDDPIRARERDLALRIAGPSELLQTARGLSLVSTEAVRNAVNTSTGETEIVYEQTHSDGTGAKIMVPNSFVIGIPVFEGGDNFRLLVRLRYRKKDRSLEWHYDIFQIKRALDVAFEEECSRISQTVALPLFYGEAP